MDDKALCGNIFTPQREATLYIRAATHQRRFDRYSVTDVATSQLANMLGAGCGNAASPDLRGVRWEFITSASTTIEMYFTY